MLPQIAQGESNKIWIIPSEFTQALGGIGSMLSQAGEAEAPPAETNSKPVAPVQKALPEDTPAT